MSSNRWVAANNPYYITLLKPHVTCLPRWWSAESTGCVQYCIAEGLVSGVYLNRVTMREAMEHVTNAVGEVENEQEG